ncbi:acetate kinase, partial [Staphylococcus aureus]
MEHERVLASGLVERIGEEVGVATHTVAAAALAPADGPAPTVVDATTTIER